VTTVDSLHVPTLLVVALLGVTTFSLSLFYLWRQAPARTMVGYWAYGYGMAAVGLALALLRQTVPVIAEFGIGQMFILAGVGMVWAGFVRFEGNISRDVLVKALVGAGVWLLADCFPEFRAHDGIRGLLASTLMASYLLGMAWSLWKGRRVEPLPSRLPLVLLFSSHGAMYFLRVPTTLFYWNDLILGYQGKAWFAVLSLEAVIHIMASSIFLMMLIKDRDQRHYQIAADVDGLTGLINRTAFVRRAQRRINQEGQAAQLLLCDLDHFKSINDTYGHEAGDKALIAFARAVHRLLPKGALFGRVGGEEFACLLKNMDLDSAHAWAEQVRRAVLDIELMHLGHRVKLAVSIGLATTDQSGPEFDTLLASADDALYRAKRGGRNCVRHFSPTSRLQNFLPGVREPATLDVAKAV
jgi:diguanylate cyclase (GGDEF)-like protein